ncbi:citrate/2-methylcitrate synthase [Azospirillum picis]|uniref:citrate synthase (unknown stereospecificity) n=1 Tax=Azospirillum picis TaxID=488438 RepID=A0ABU0MN02_9PROT|nr:citrate/2-methylcitrate synthase [Azospirillum picis]MBP2301186.1 citrate synthase [Azospirillum picis]MDQ0534851.1 citrate synthase [Azospirillum picis]
MAAYLSAEGAANRLGVSRQTLYAYVSRGLLQAHPAEDPRQSRYLVEEVERLGAERRRGRRPKEVAKSTLDWGTPVLESAITLIHRGRLHYRGRDAARLAETATLEETAALLWNCAVEAAFPPEPPPVLPGYDALLPHCAATPPAEALPTLLAAATADEATASWRRADRRFLGGCGNLVRLLFAAARRGRPSAAPLHAQLAEAWGLDQGGAELVRMALVLCADHELNASGFTARCVASTGASLRAAVIGGLCALSGSRHGATTTRIEHFWNALSAGGTVATQLERRLAAGEAVPGLGHPLYPDGDIRARALLSRILPHRPEMAELLHAAEDLTGRAPTIDLALVALRRHLGLPEGAAFTLFALGRTAGWIAHALEQRETGQLIRPRAVYTGPEPE